MITDKIADAYRALILRVLLNARVRAIICDSEEEHFFDRVVVHDNNTLSVYKYGLKKPWNNFYFDFALDFATMLQHIEFDLLNISHNVEPKYYNYEFLKDE